MAFFDKIGETISTKSKDVAKKAKDFANITKLNSQISTEEDKVNTTFQSIGQDYFAQNKDDVTNVYVERFQVILDAQQRIDKMQKEIQSIKGTKQCTNCGGDVAVNTSFCSSCGSKVEEEPEDVQEPEQAQEQEQEQAQETTKTCPKCGVAIEENEDFCVNCGTEAE